MIDMCLRAKLANKGWLSRRKEVPGLGIRITSRSGMLERHSSALISLLTGRFHAAVAINCTPPAR